MNATIKATVRRAFLLARRIERDKEELASIKRSLNSDEVTVYTVRQTTVRSYVRRAYTARRLRR